MIARLAGVLLELSPTRVVVDVGGVGYEVGIPLSTFGELPDIGKTLALHIHTHIREGSFQLFGFHTAEERVAFELLLRASRVGPKLAQTVLSGITPAELLAAIRGNGVRVLCAVPGIGTKMAERMLVELRDRTDALAAVVATSGGSAAVAEVAIGAEDDVRQQALSALQNLGYPKVQAERVLASAESDVGSDATIETLVRGALRRLAR